MHSAKDMCKTVPGHKQMENNALFFNGRVGKSTGLESHNGGMLHRH